MSHKQNLIETHFICIRHNKSMRCSLFLHCINRSTLFDVSAHTYTRQCHWVDFHSLPTVGLRVRPCPPYVVRRGSYQNECLDRNDASATGFWGRRRFAASAVVVAPSVRFILFTVCGVVLPGAHTNIASAGMHAHTTRLEPNRKGVLPHCVKYAYYVDSWPPQLNS